MKHFRRWLVIRRSVYLIAAMIVAAGASLSKASELPSPEGDTVLEISGTLEATNSNGKALFDMEMLKALPETRFRTTTIWTAGEITFEGVELYALLQAVGANGSEITAAALNDYAVTIPMSDARPGGPIIAYSMNGAAMSRREKGPLWIVYPYDLKPDYQSEVYFSRSIWQLTKLHIQ